MSTGLRDPLLLVGFQRGVLPALARVGRPAVLLIDQGRQRPDQAAIEGVLEVDLHGPAALIEAAARALLAGREPAAVISLAERTVVVAAQLRAAFGLPGNTPETALACADKVVMKRTMEAAGIPVAAWCEVTRETTAHELVETLGLPLVIKPRRDSGGRDQRVSLDLPSTAAALAELERAAPRAVGWLAEGWIVGEEMSIETFVHDAEPAFFNPTEYLVPRHANVLPAELEPDTWDAVRTFVARALAAAGVERGITHLELFRTARGLVFGELATRPPGGRLMQLLERAWGFDPWLALLHLELGQAVAFPTAPSCCAGVWVLHPGPGTLTGLGGLERARAVPGVQRISLKAGVGDVITRRLGSGQDIGSIYVEAADRAAVAAALNSARELLRFELG